MIQGISPVLTTPASIRRNERGLHHNVLKSSGTSPNLPITLASLKSPVAGSPLRLNATAPTWPALRESASARITTAGRNGLIRSRLKLIGVGRGIWHGVLRHGRFRVD